MDERKIGEKIDSARFFDKDSWNINILILGINKYKDDVDINYYK